ncbi:MAG: YigZ family protein [Bacteroidales bacterium]|nr:YigZ family protein [Bacteroidales bacterium]
MEEFDLYKSIDTPSEGIYKESGSRFLAFAYPVESEDEAKSLLQEKRKEYYDARHHCLAFRIGYKGDLWRASDDGEPSGSAGKPILGQIDSAGLSDIAVIVVRYFGGVKLGIPGLVRAYKTATADAISNARIISKTATKSFALGFDYSQMNAVMKALKALDMSPWAQEFDGECSLKVRVRLSQEEVFKEKLQNIANLKEI